VAVPGTKIFGVQVGEILQSRPADLAGIKPGDIIVEFDKVPIRTIDELDARIRRAIPYSTVAVVVMRGGEKIEIPVKMGKR
jgi:S1-C subfamily serine protease